MLGGIVKGIGSALGGTVKGIAGAAADVAGISDFTSALGGEKKVTDKPKAAKPKAFDEDESPTKVLQRILGEVQSIHKVMASQVVPPSEEEEIERDKDKKDDEVLDALGNIVPKEEKKKKKPWWKMALMAIWTAIKALVAWITKPLSWIKSLLKLPFFIGLTRFVITLGRFLLFNPVGIALLTIGIVAINWKAIKKAIKGYWTTFKGWVEKTLTFLGLEGLIPEEVEVLGDSATDDESSADDIVPPEATDEEVLQALEDLPDADETTTDEATGARIVGKDHPVTVTPETAGEPLGDIVGQNAVEGVTDEAKAMVTWSTGDMGTLYFNEAQATQYQSLKNDERKSRQESQRYESVEEAKIKKELKALGIMGGKVFFMDDDDPKKREFGAREQQIEITARNMIQAPKDATLLFLNQMKRDTEQQDKLKKSWDDKQQLKDAGEFQVGGKIPQGSEGLVHAGETVRKQGENKGGIVQSEGMMQGPTTVTRAKPEKRLSMSEYWKQQASGGAAAWSQTELHKKEGKDYYDRSYLRAGMTEADKQAEGKADRAMLYQRDMDLAGTSGKAGGLDSIARQRRAGLGISQLFGGRQLGKAMIDKRNVTKQAQGAFSVDQTSGWLAGKHESGLAKIGWDAELIQNMIKGRGKGRGGEEFSPKQIKFYMAVADFGIDFAQLKDINNTRIRELGTLQDAAGIDSTGANQNWAITILNAMRQNLSSQDLTESIEGGMRMVAAQMQNMPSINESTLQQAGQQSTVSVVNQSNTQNISTASSSSNQNNVGQTQQSIPISNTHGAAPRSV